MDGVIVGLWFASHRGLLIFLTPFFRARLLRESRWYLMYLD